MSNDNEEQIVEDVEEKDLVENQELEVEETEAVVEETTEEVSEETEVTEDQPLSDAVLNVLLGEKTKKEETEEESEEEEEESEEEVEEAKKVKEDEDESEDESEEDEEEVSESAEDEDEDEDESEVAEEVEEDEDESDEVEEDEEEEEESDEDEVELPEVKTKAGYLASSFDKLKGMKKTELVSAFSALNMTEEDEDEVEVPKTKADIINSVYGQLKAMKKDDLMASYQSIMASNYESVKEETEANLFADDLKVLASTDQELTEDFKAKASILFEGAVANKVAEIKESLEAEYSENLQEEVTYVRESLVAKIDDYLSYVVESWIEENQEFVDNKLRTEISENFMKALQSTFTEHYIEVPDSKVDLVDELSDEVTSIKESLEIANAEKSELASQVEELSREKVISEATSDLASTQAGKFNKLLEEVTFENTEQFAEKVATIKEGFFSESASTEEVSQLDEDKSVTTNVETIVEGQVDANANLPKDMQKYVQHLSRFNP